MTVQLEWDEAKRLSNLIKHKIDFEGLASIFTNPRRVEVPDERREYGEPRMTVLCPVHGRLLHVTYTPRGRARRIISARVASRREQRFHEQAADYQGNRDA